jgi:hypothetical protein
MQQAIDMTDELISVEVPTQGYGPRYPVPQARLRERTDGTDLIVLQPREVTGTWEAFLWRAPDIFGPLLVVTLVALVWRMSRMGVRSQPAGKPCCARCGYQLGPPLIAVRRVKSDPIVAEPGAACPECGVKLEDTVPVMGRSFKRRVIVPLLVGVSLVVLSITMLVMSLELHAPGFGKATWPLPDLEKQTRWAVQRREPKRSAYVTDVSCHDVETRSLRWRVRGLTTQSPQDAQIVGERYLAMVCVDDPNSPVRLAGSDTHRVEGAGQIVYVLSVIDLQDGSLRSLDLDASAGGAWSMVDGPGKGATARVQHLGHTLRQPPPAPGESTLEYFLDLHAVDCATLEMRKIVREPVESRATLPGGGFLLPYSAFLVPRDSDGTKYAVFFGHRQLQGGTTIASEGLMLMVEGERRSLQRFSVSGMGWMSPSLSPEQDRAEFMTFGGSFGRGSVDWSGAVRFKPPGAMPLENHVVSSKVEPDEAGPRFHAEAVSGVPGLGGGGVMVYRRGEVVEAWRAAEGASATNPGLPVMPAPWATTKLGGRPSAVSNDGLMVAGIRSTRVEGRPYWRAARDDVRVVVVQANPVANGTQEK